MPPHDEPPTMLENTNWYTLPDGADGGIGGDAGGEQGGNAGGGGTAGGAGGGNSGGGEYGGAGAPRIVIKLTVPRPTPLPSWSLYAPIARTCGPML